MEKENQFYIIFLFFGILVCIVLLLAINILPKYLAENYTENYEIKTGCIYIQSSKKSRYSSVFLADNHLGSTIDKLTIKNSPFYKNSYEKNKNILSKKLLLSNGECYLIKYIEVDLKFYKKSFIYDFLEYPNEF